MAPAAVGEKDRLAFGGRRSSRRRGVCRELIRDPRAETRRVERYRFHPHVGVRQPAEFGALAEVHTRLIGLHPQRVHPTRDGIALTVQLGDPERVDHVATGDPQQHMLSGGNHHLVGGDDGLRDAPRQTTWLYRVVVFPPPLLAGDVDDALGVARLGEIEQRLHRRDTDADQDQRRNDGERNLERRLAMRLLRDDLAAIAELDHAQEHDTDDDHEHDAGDHERRALQIVDLASVLAGRLERVLRRVLGTAGEQRQRTNGRRRQCRAAIARTEVCHPVSRPIVHEANGSQRTRTATIRRRDILGQMCHGTSILSLLSMPGTSKKYC